MGPIDVKYDLDEMVEMDRISIPTRGRRYEYATMTTTHEDPKAPLEIESRQENGLTVFRLVDTLSITYMAKIFKQMSEQMERTGRRPDLLYTSMTTLKYIAEELKPGDFEPSPGYRLTDSTIYGMKLRITDSVPDGQVYLIREEPWL